MIALDIETELDNTRPSGQRVTIASIVDIDTGRLTQFDEWTVHDLVPRLAGQTVIGYNIISFDLRVLSDYAGYNLTNTCDAFDIYRQLARQTGRSDISLDELAAGTLGRAQPSHGGDLYAMGQIRQLRENSANGTREIAAIYRIGRDRGAVRWIDQNNGLTHDIPVLWT